MGPHRRLEALVETPTFLMRGVERGGRERKREERREEGSEGKGRGRERKLIREENYTDTQRDIQKHRDTDYIRTTDTQKQTCIDRHRGT